MMQAVFEDACREISSSLLACKEPTKSMARAQIKRVCAKYSLARIPANDEILSFAGDGYARLQKILLKKPAKTASGVAVIALMPKPYACPHGRCTYCPGGPEYNTPNSYTGAEPVAAGAMRVSYEPGLQIRERLSRLHAYGHDASKLELVIVGGTFLFMPKEYQENFIKSCFEELAGTTAPTLDAAQKACELAIYRNVGLTIETKPDYCKAIHVDAMLRFGATRVEIGVQSLREKAYTLTNRGHTYKDVVESFRISKDAGYKITAHMMPGLPGATPEKDIEDLTRLFSDSDLKPDMLKIYPTLVLRGTPLYEEYVSGRYKPYSDEDMVRVISEAKSIIPKWVRIMRVQREITPAEIVAGPASGNLRQLVHQNLALRNLSCKCIRCREPGSDGRATNLKLERIDYESSGGMEHFVSYIDAEDTIYGFLRLRVPGPLAHRPEVEDSSIVRELHVYGRQVGVGRREQDGIQHSGIGKALMAEAERITRESGRSKILVISAVGTREYYRKMGYSRDGPYMAKVPV